MRAKLRYDVPTALRRGGTAFASALAAPILLGAIWGFGMERTERVQGVLRRAGARPVDIECIAHFTGFGRVPAFFELLALPEPLEPDEIVLISCGDSPPMVCRALIEGRICAVIGAA